MTITTVDLTPRIGTEIKTDAATMLSGTAAQEIRDVLAKRGVVVFRGVDLDDDQQLAFGKTLGAVRQEGGHSIMKVTLDTKENPQFADYFRATVSWHLDGTHDDVPPLASILTPRVLSATGGQTEFANTYAAYEDLPESEKKFLDGLKVVHTKTASMAKFTTNPTEEQLAAWRNYPPKIHPLVWRHRSGRKSLVLSTSWDHVVGMDRKESDALLQRLTEWTTKRDYVYQHQWKMGDLLMWDNTGTIHRVLPYDPASLRRLHRVTLIGEEALSVAA